MNVFLKAIELLERDGWCKKKYKNLSGERCLVGACTEARYNKSPGEASYTPNISGDRLGYLTYAALFESTPQMDVLFKLTDTLPTIYNDRSSTTKEDVIELLRKASTHECAVVNPTEPSSVQPAS